MGIALEDIESQISDAFLVARNTIRTLMQEAREKARPAAKRYSLSQEEQKILEDIVRTLLSYTFISGSILEDANKVADIIVIMYKESEIPIQKFFSLITDTDTDDSSFSLSDGSGSLLQKEISYEEVPIYSYHNNVPVEMIMGVRRITTITIGNIILEKKERASL